MTLFFILAALMVLLCLGWLLTGLFRSGRIDTDQEAVNVTLARERREILDSALAAGSIDEETYQYERKQLEYDLAADLQSGKQQSVQHKGHVPAAVLVSVFVPIAAGALYLHLGNPHAISMDLNTQPQPTADSAAPSLTELLPQIEERLAKSPDDVDGWRLLGRSYMSVNEFYKARQALEKALALDENDVPTLAQLAESIAMTQDGNLAGEPMQYLQRAQTLDADNEHSLWLLSIARQQAGEHKAALTGFNKLADRAAQNPEALATIEQMKQISLDALAQQAAPTPSDAKPADQSGHNPDSSSESEADGISLNVSVSLSEAALASVASDHAVFVYAKATQGPPMPLAVSRLSVADLPTTVTLDDSMAMIPGMNLSAYTELTVGARVSSSGNAIAQSGDWFQEIQGTSLSEDSSIDIVIDKQTP